MPLRRCVSGERVLQLADVAGHPVRDAAGRVGGVHSAFERDDLDRIARDSLGLRGRAHPGRVRSDDDYSLGHRSSVRHCTGRTLMRVATGQAASVVVRISFPGHRHGDRGFLPRSRPAPRWSSSTPCSVISRSIHRLFWSLTTSVTLTSTPASAQPLPSAYIRSVIAVQASSPDSNSPNGLGPGRRQRPVHLFRPGMLWPGVDRQDFGEVGTGALVDSQGQRSQACGRARRGWNHY